MHSFVGGVENEVDKGSYEKSNNIFRSVIRKHDLQRCGFGSAEIVS